MALRRSGSYQTSTPTTSIAFCSVLSLSFPNIQSSQLSYLLGQVTGCLPFRLCRFPPWETYLPCSARLSPLANAEGRFLANDLPHGGSTPNLDPSVAQRTTVAPRPTHRGGRREKNAHQLSAQAPPLQAAKRSWPFDPPGPLRSEALQPARRESQSQPKHQPPATRWPLPRSQRTSSQAKPQVANPP
jgi:hypothetical protein